MMKFSELPKSEQPLARLNYLGARGLSNAELISLAGGIDDTETVYRLISMTDTGIRDLRNMDVHTFMEAGLTEIEAGNLSLSLEIGTRLNVAMSFYEELSDPQAVYEHAEEIWSEPQEHMLVFCINGRNVMIRKDTVSIGNNNTTIADPADVMRPAILHGATGIILVHNHPSERTVPSQLDLRVTKEIIAAAELYNIKVKDHVIVSASEYTSMRQLLGDDFFRTGTYSNAEKMEAASKLMSADEPVPYVSAPEAQAAGNSGINDADEYEYELDASYELEADYELEL